MARKYRQLTTEEREEIMTFMSQNFPYQLSYERVSAKFVPQTGFSQRRLTIEVPIDLIGKSVQYDDAYGLLLKTRKRTGLD